MRIIAGEFRRRTLAAPVGMETRPTSDRLRETLFNVLAPRLEGAGFLDLYAGSGAVALEAVSRGAARVEAVERAAGALKALTANVQALKAEKRLRVHAVSVAAYLKKAAGPFDVVFLDPPYELAKEYDATLGALGGWAAQLLAPGAVVVAEHRKKAALAERYGTLERMRVLEQGDAGLSFYEVLAA